MRTALGCLVGVALAITAVAQVPNLVPKKVLTADDIRIMMAYEEYWRTQYRRYRRIEKRANELRPQLRTSPMRELNISDNEIREVQELVRHHLPQTYVNISPVVTDCPCEEGPACTAQVYVTATEGDKAVGVQLSRMKDVWGIGAVQKWWHQREAIQVQKTGIPSYDDFLYRKAVNELYNEFPICASSGLPATAKK